MASPRISEGSREAGEEVGGEQPQPRARALTRTQALVQVEEEVVGGVEVEEQELGGSQRCYREGVEEIQATGPALLLSATWVWP